MPKSRIPSPARSQGGITTPRRNKPRGSRSVCSPALSTASGRLTSLIDQFKDKNMESFALSPLSGRSVLNDNTDVEEPRRKSWWRKLDENSQDVMEVFENNKLTDANNVIEEFIDIEVLSQEKKNYTLDLPESSDNESINSIVLPQRKLFTQKENQPQKKFGQLIGNRETLAKLHKTNNTNMDKTVNVGTRELFQNTKRSKPIFPAALLNISPNKTAADKTKENVAIEPKPQVRNIFGNRPANKRKNIFADFIASESEDEISEIQPKVFGFQKKLEQQRISSVSKGRDNSPTSSITTDMLMDEWKHLPSSTLVENQLEDMLAGQTPIKRARLSKLSEAKESEAGTNTLQTNTSADKTKQHHQHSADDYIDSNLEHDQETEVDQYLKAKVGDEKVVENQLEDKVTGQTPIKKARFSKLSEAKESEARTDTLQTNTTADKTKQHHRHSADDYIEDNLEHDQETEIDQNIQAKVRKQKVVENKLEDKVADQTPLKKARLSEVKESEAGSNTLQSNTTVDKTKNYHRHSADDYIDGNLEHDQETEINQNVKAKVGKEKNIENQLEDMVASQTPIKKARLSKLSEPKESDIGTNILQTNTTADKTKQHHQHSADDNFDSSLEHDLVTNTDLNLKAKVEEEKVVKEQVNVEINNESKETIIEEIENEVETGESLVNENEEVVSQEVNESEENGDETNSSQENQNESQELENDENEISEDEANESENEVDESQEIEEEANKSEEIETKESQKLVLNESQEVEEEANESQEVEEANESQEVESANESSEIEEDDIDTDEGNEKINEDESNDLRENEDTAEESREIQNESQENGDESQEVESEADISDCTEGEDDQQIEDSVEADKAIASDVEVSDEDNNPDNDMEVDDDENQQETVDDVNEREENQDESQEDIQNEQNEVEPSVEEIEESPNVTHDTTGRNRKKDQSNKSPEVILYDKTNHMDSFTAIGRNTSVRKTKSIIKNLNITSSLAPPRDSTGFSDGTRNSSAERSGWDSHRTTRKTLRQTFGKDFTPRKSLRTLVMEKSAKRQTEHMDIHSETVKFPQANSTEFPEIANHDVEDIEESDHEISRRTRQTTLEIYLQRIKQQNIEKKLKMEEAVRNSLKGPTGDTLSLFKVPSIPAPRRPKPTQGKPKKQIKSIIPFHELPSEVIQDMKYKPPKRFQPTNASWITKRLYKFLENKLEPKYDYKARVRAEKLVETIYHFAKDLRRHDVAPTDAVEVLKHELARLDVVHTHFEFYEFFHEFMPREVRVKVVPDIVNKIPLPRHGVFSEILRGNTIQG